MPPAAMASRNGLVMRLWTLHPRYLDARGLVALWRETLLAQAVLRGETRGYTRHPQLVRFRSSSAPTESISRYLQSIHDEALRRGYAFDETKISPCKKRIEAIAVTRGQIEYEWAHLEAKLRVRSPLWLAGLTPLSYPEAHPLFRIVSGPVASWEIVHGDHPAG